MKKPVAPESTLHRSVADYLTTALRPPTFWTTIGHGGGGKARGANLKRMGVKAGVPDVMILHNTRAYFIELKKEDGRMKDSQKETFPQIENAGSPIAVCRSVDEVRDALSHWRLPVWARLAA